MSLLGVSINFTDTAGAVSVAEGAVTVDLDASLLIHLGFFLVLLLVLKPALFDPMMKLFEEREKRIEGTRHRATKEDERSAKALAKYEASLNKARDEGARERDALRAEGQKREADLMGRVRAEVAQTLESGRTEITKEADAARLQLRAEAHGLGRDMAARVLGREVAS
jgi:F-type H+-transporting ATPase subunit b